MPVTRLNHAVLFVRNVEQSVAFYREALAFEKVMGMPGAAFLQAPASSNDHDLGLFEIGAGAGPRRPAAARSGCTTWRGRWTRSTSSAGSRRSSPSSAR